MHRDIFPSLLLYERKLRPQAVPFSFLHVFPPFGRALSTVRVLCVTVDLVDRPDLECGARNASEVTSRRTVETTSLLKVTSKVLGFLTSGPSSESSGNCPKLCSSLIVIETGSHRLTTAPSTPLTDAELVLEHSGGAVVRMLPASVFAHVIRRLARPTKCVLFQCPEYLRVYSFLFRASAVCQSICFESQV